MSPTSAANRVRLTAPRQDEETDSQANPNLNLDPNSNLKPIRQDEETDPQAKDAHRQNQYGGGVEGANYSSGGDNGGWLGDARSWGISEAN